MRQLIKMISPLLGKIGLLKYILLGILSGLCGFLFINLLTRVVDLIITGNFKSISKEYIIIFSFIILFFIWTRRTLSLAIINLSQKLFWKLRKQILSLILKADYQQLSSKKAQIHSSIVSDINILTQASMNVIEFFIASIMSIACLVYLASISFMLFSITLGVATLGIIVYIISSKKNNQDFEKARSLENSFLENLNIILNGFKEIYMEPKKGKYINEHKINTIASDSYKSNMAAFTGFLNNQIIGQVLFYILISSILLFFSITLNIKTSDTVRYIFTLLYLLNAIEIVMVLLPSLMRARVAGNRLINLKNELEQADFNNQIAKKYFSKNEFDQIMIRHLSFHYGKEDKAFSIGPINFDIQQGETIFIYGGNGSGKTTFIYALLGLCVPSEGEIKLNDSIINNDNYAEYRSTFSVMFSDFYLFNEVLGVDKVDLEKWNYYLQLFEIEEKVKLEGKHFSTTDLSTGQRKRLALIAMLLEEKPILVLDEWAADQDPHFRKKFYTEIIPILKNDGVTIIAITHDDKYYHCADKLYRMDYGKLILEDISMYNTNLSPNNFANIES